MRVENWMTKSAPIVRSGSKVSDALKAMELYKVRELVVVDDSGTFLGIVNKEDVFNKDPDSKVDDFLTFQELFVHPRDPIEGAILGFMESNEDFIPVVDEEMKVVGVITLQDVLESMIEITAMDEPGCRVSMVLEDVPGSLKRVVDVLAENSVNILSILTYREDEGRRRVVMRLDVKDKEEIERIFKTYGIDYDSITEEEGF